MEFEDASDDLKGLLRLSYQFLTPRGFRIYRTSLYSGQLPDPLEAEAKREGKTHLNDLDWRAEPYSIGYVLSNRRFQMAPKDLLLKRAEHAADFSNGSFVYRIYEGTGERSPWASVRAHA